MKQPWNTPLHLRHLIPPFQEIVSQFPLLQYEEWPNAEGLNTMSIKHSSYDVPDFVCQDNMPKSDMYYEEIIAHTGKVPTRPQSWHDLFNGLVWHMFPQTKRLLNHIHMQDISEFGVNPRTPRRNRVTHFDECGIVLAVSEVELLDLLREHAWHEIFVENRQCWGTVIKPFVFGHANLEMLLEPFIGLTGKWLAVEVSDAFFTLPFEKQLIHLDERLVSQIRDQDLFSMPRVLKPIPLLGIPEWWEANRDPQFYENRDYFRPRRT
ncbi:DUF3025 domain-containing protein [Aestuariibacter sp. AA17]|uniref:DUF3025 domain-containing protein n=1 Tax=Fluctibacter corallii TaxID=2984329 RepID=A0ABT3AAB0_9ALTE|nr:DUF3025 domain-containing protein [Aestuariibacter sp. AA17]MCV2885610.1 DUF3025 domain-containing protein [Aestuariibacter sp. AA17]